MAKHTQKEGAMKTKTSNSFKREAKEVLQLHVHRFPNQRRKLRMF